MKKEAIRYYQIQERLLSLPQGRDFYLEKRHGIIKIMLLVLFERLGQLGAKNKVNYSFVRH